MVDKSDLLGNRFLTLATVIRVRQVEMSRDEAEGPDESALHTPAEGRTFRETIREVWPDARITWAFSWRALHDERENYVKLRELAVAYHKELGDEITFIPGGFFANMYNTREQVNKDLHEALSLISEMVGDGYRPKAVIAGFLAAENLRYLAEEEGIHVCQGNIWSQYAVDNGDGEGSISYPYYPSKEHFCKPAQGPEDFIDCVNLDGWTVDFLNARYRGGHMVNGEWWGSRQGVGPIETFIRLGHEEGLREVLATTAAHFDEGYELNGFSWVTVTWELSLVEARKVYNYNGRNGMEGLRAWMSEIQTRWPGATCITHGEFGTLWRSQFSSNDGIDYRFVQRGSGIRGSDPNVEVRWFMNKDFRLATQRQWKENGHEEVIDFTRYDLPAEEPADPEDPADRNRNWSLMNRLNQKGTRPQDSPTLFSELTDSDRSLVRTRYDEFNKDNV